MFIDDIKTASPFRDLFPIQEELLDRLTWDMRKHGYDPSKPIVLWGPKSIVIDGHTRLRAARKAGLYQIPVVLKEFAGMEEALQYAIGCQRNRRNLRDADILRYVSELEALTKPRCKGEMVHTLGQSTRATAALLGVSKWKVEKTKSVLHRAPEEIIAAVKAGEISINRAYERTIKPAIAPPDPIDAAFRNITDKLSNEEISELISRLQVYLGAP